MKVKIIISFVLSIATMLFGQISPTVTISTYSDDNVLRLPEPTADVVTDIGLNLTYHPEKTNLQISFQSNFFRYLQLSERNFSLHTIGLSSYKSFGNDAQHTFYFGSDFDLRINGEDYNYYNYNQFYLYGNLLFNFQSFLLRSGYNFRYRGYSNLPELSNFRHYFFLQFNKSFATRTTLILESDLGYKSFSGQSSEVIYSTGHGRRWTNSSTTISSAGPALSHIILLSRISQSLHSKVGFFVQYKKQISLDQQSEFLNNDGYFQDEELFDDPFSYESDQISSQLTWILPYQMTIKLFGGKYKKEYISEQAFTSAEDSVGLGGPRSDDGSRLFISFDKKFNLNKNWLKTITLGLNYNYLINESNSYWYNYKNSILSGKITLNF